MTVKTTVCRRKSKEYRVVILLFLPKLYSCVYCYFTVRFNKVVCVWLKHVKSILEFISNLEGINKLNYLIMYVHASQNLMKPDRNQFSFNLKFPSLAFYIGYWAS